MRGYRCLHAPRHEQVLYRVDYEQRQEGSQHLFEAHSNRYGQEEEGSDQRQRLGI